MSYCFGIFACGEIGRQAVELFREKKEQLRFVVLDRSNMWNMNETILNQLKDYVDTRIYYYTDYVQLLDICAKVDAVILAFWGGISKVTY